MEDVECLGQFGRWSYFGKEAHHRTLGEPAAPTVLNLETLQEKYYTEF